MSLAAVPRRARPFGLAAAVLVGPLLPGCGSSTPTLNTVAEERAIAASILTQHHLHAAVQCPSDPSRKAGFTFTCTAKFDVGTYPVTVTETNGRGHVRYQDQDPLVALDIAKVEQSIAQSIRTQRRLGSTVICPAEVLQKAGIVFTCTATVSGRRYPFAVTEVDGDGHVRYIGR
jgi:uncharacterized protein DUF4333